MLRCAVCIVIIVLEYCSAGKRYTRSSRPADAARDVHIDTGTVGGHLAHDAEGSYYAFLGIPYAAPMMSKNRFKAPLPRTPWDRRKILVANRTIVCPQQQLNQASEDCLVVNVFTPIAKMDKLIPVLVIIHGGAYSAGLPYTSGVAPLICQGIIVVTIAYRLGVLGFLCSGVHEAPGNAGLKDQTAALRWVQKNIQHFGGDPAQVTLYGSSSGGACVELHVLSKMSTGLFQRAVVESGSALPVWATDGNPIRTALNFAESYLQLPRVITKDLNNLVSSLQEKSAYVLGEHAWAYYNSLTDGSFGLSPCVERELNGTQTFISKSPYEILTKQEYSKVPIMFIISTGEGLYFRSEEYQDYVQRMEANFLNFMPADLIFDREEIKQEVGKIIKNVYFGNKPVGDKTNKIQYLDYFGDYLVMHGLFNSAEMHARDGNAVYLMEFAYKGELGYYEEHFENISLSAHSDFREYVFIAKSPPNEWRAVERATKLLANFVRFGNPTPAPTQLLPVIWPRVQSGNVSYLRMDQEFTVHSLKDSPYWGRKVFWDTLYNKYRRHIWPVDPKKVRV